MPFENYEQKRGRGVRWTPPSLGRVKEALELVECLLKSKSDLRGKTLYSVGSIMSLFRWMFSQTYCEYDGNFYSLESGPIGLGVTGELAMLSSTWMIFR